MKFLRILLILFIAFNFSLVKAQGKWQMVDTLTNDIFSHLNSIDCFEENCIYVGNVRDVILSRYSSNNGENWTYGFLDSSRPTSNNNINKIVMPSADIAFAIADKGYYYRSTDLGRSWEYGHLDVSVNLLDIDFYDDKFGVIVSALEVSITRDGGETWEIQKHQDYPVINKDFVYLWRVDIVDENIIYISGKNKNGEYRLTYSYDGGKTWKVTEGLASYFEDIHFFDKMHGLAVGTSTGTMNTVFETSDGGNTWNKLLDTSDKTSNRFVKLIVENDSIYTVLGYGRHLWRTTNSGKNWNRLAITYTKIPDSFSFTKLRDSVYLFCTYGGAFVYRYELDGYTDVEEMPISDIEYEPFSLYPNPARDELTIKSEQPLLDYELTDVFGTILNSEKELLLYGMQPELRVNTSKLSAGIYFLKIKTLDGIEYRKFIKE